MNKQFSPRGDLSPRMRQDPTLFHTRSSTKQTV